VRIDYADGHRARTAQSVLALYGIAVTLAFGVKVGPDPAAPLISRIEVTDADAAKTLEMLRRHDLMGSAG
jgi:hypothetical protein